MVALKGLDYKVPILTSLSITLPMGAYLLGGVAGTDFWVSALGLEQPRAARGIVRPGVVIPFGVQLPAHTIRWKTLGRRKDRSRFQSIRYL